MRCPQALTVRLALAAMASLPYPARAAESPPSTATPSATTEAARAHFKSGVKLYQDQSYTAALAEFEAAYALKPGPGSLQNIALCEKALLRYADAADALERLLSDHGAELSDAERTAAKQAKAELDALVGRVQLEVSPADAEVTLDGQPFTRNARGTSVRVSVGEHTISASAPGHARATQTFRVASEREVEVHLDLVATAGVLDITAPDATSAIAIDGKPVAYGHYVGPVTPDVEHLVQIYKDGAPPFETRVKVALGATLAVPSAATPDGPVPSPTSPAPATPGNANTPSKKPPLGWFALGSVSLLGATAAPFRFDLSDAKSRAFGLGLRGGRRFHPALAVEGLLEYSALNVSNACDAYRGELMTPRVECGSPEASALDVSYSVRSFRFGPLLELMTTGPAVRALGGLGLGLVWHELSCDGCVPGKSQSSNGTDAFFLMELGIGANTRHVLMALTVQTLFDGTKAMVAGRSIDAGSGEAPVHETAYDRSGRVLAYLGLDLRLGFSEWAP